MQTIVGEERVLKEIQNAVGDALRLDPEAVLPEASLVADLGAASLDFLDINYKIEQTFGIRMARYFVIEHAEELLGEGAVIDDLGRITERGMALLGRRYGSSSEPAPKTSIHVDQVPELITARAITEAVMDILGTLPSRCPCGDGEWDSADGAKISCTSCGEAAAYEDGDERIRKWLASSEGLGGGPG